jgi:hypothetical protein
MYILEFFVRTLEYSLIAVVVVLLAITIHSGD